MAGKDYAVAPHTRKWFVIAFGGYGPHIPTIPAIILARNLAQGSIKLAGATPCVGMVTLDDYLAEMRKFPVKTFTE